MKSIGDKAEYIPARNKDLYEVYKRKVSETRQIRLLDVLGEVVKSPAKRFYIGERQAQVAVTSLLNGRPVPGVRPERRRMYDEIYRRCLDAMSGGRAVPLAELVREVIAQPAPEFYLTPGSAKVILHYIRKEGRG